MCEADLHEMTFYPRKWFKAKPKLKAGEEFLYDGAEYKNLYGHYYELTTEHGTYHIDPCNAEVIGGVPVWVAVDSNGREAKHHCFKPKRHYQNVATMDIIHPCKTIGFWFSEETGRAEYIGKKMYPFVYEREELEPGTIENLIGRKLTFRDEPVQIE